MQPKNEVSNLIKMLKPHVQNFSAGFQMNGKHGDVVVCGGKITHAIDMSNFTNNEKEQLVYVQLDDGVGEFLILVTKSLWEQGGWKKGDIILAKGLLFMLKKELIFQSEAGTKIKQERRDEPLRLLTETIKTLSRS